MLSEDLAGEIDTALRQATDAMSKASNLLALVLAPRVSGARLSHVELLALQPHQLMYVFIVSTGAVMKGMIEWPQAIDAGLMEWARTYLNETLHDQTLTARLVRRVLANPELSPREAGFLAGSGASLREAGGRAVSGGAVRGWHRAAPGGAAPEGRLVAARPALACSKSALCCCRCCGPRSPRARWWCA